MTPYIKYIVMQIVMLFVVSHKNGEAGNPTISLNIILTFNLSP